MGRRNTGAILANLAAGRASAPSIPFGSADRSSFFAGPLPLVPSPLGQEMLGRVREAAIQPKTPEALQREKDDLDRRIKIAEDKVNGMKGQLERGEILPQWVPTQQGFIAQAEQELAALEKERQDLESRGLGPRFEAVERQRQLGSQGMINIGEQIVDPQKAQEFRLARLQKNVEAGMDLTGRMFQQMKKTLGWE